MVGPKKQDLGARINMLEVIFLKVLLMNIFLSKIGHDFIKGPFKYYVIKEVGGLGQKMAIGWVGLKKSKT